MHISTKQKTQELWLSTWPNATQQAGLYLIGTELHPYDLRFPSYRPIFKQRTETLLSTQFVYFSM